MTVCAGEGLSRSIRPTSDLACLSSVFVDRFDFPSGEGELEGDVREWLFDVQTEVGKDAIELVFDSHRREPDLICHRHPTHTASDEK